MKKNKQAKRTLALVSGWDQYRPINKRLNNNVVVSLDSSRQFYLLGGWVKGAKKQ